MAVVNFTCPPTLASAWQHTLRRDGLQVDADGPDAAHVVVDGRRHRIWGGRHGTELDLFIHGVSDRHVRDRIALVLTASGARFPPPSPGTGTLFIRLPDEVHDGVWQALERRGVTVELERRPSFGGHSPAEPYLAGWLRRGRGRVRVEIGPAVEPETGAETHWILLRPRYLGSMSPDLLSLLRDAAAELDRLGGAVIARPRALVTGGTNT